MRIAFYAPLKPPAHPVPSGDRAVARLLCAALQAAGHTVELASELRSFTPVPDADRLAALRDAAAQERAALRARWPIGMAPDLWFTYHPYYKAPDLIGPPLAAALGIPYVAAEASWAARHARDAWSDWQAAAEPALRQAALLVCPTTRDRAGLIELLGKDAALLDLPPFLDLAAAPVPGRARPASGTVRLIVTAMMRPSNKRDSYRFLAAALRQLPHLPWTLDIVGDGMARPDVEAAFADLAPQRLRWHGECPPGALHRLLAEADIFVWPGVREAYGMSFLEAAAAGLPAVATADGGVPAVVIDGRTGLLTPPGDVAAYAHALAGLITDGVRRHTLGAAARRFVVDERSLETAARSLGSALQRFVREPAL